MKVLLEKMLGTRKSIKSQIEFISSLNISDEQKEKQIGKVLTNSSSFKIIQRLIAFTFTLLYIITISLVLTTKYMGFDTKDLLTIMTTFNLGNIILAILGFYFTGGALNSIRKD